MNLSKSYIKQLQQMMEKPQWGAVEYAFEEYLRQNFTKDSVKREDQFNTLWFAAFAEGGKHHLNDFFNQLNEIAKYD